MSRDYAKKNRAPGSTSAGATRSTTDKRSSKDNPASVKRHSGKKAATRQPPARKSSQRSTPRTARPAGQSGGLSLRWILSLALIGGFAGFIVYLNSLPSPGSTGPAGQPPASANHKTVTTAPKTRQDKEHFQFYDMLPDSEVVPPKVEEYDPGPPPAQRSYSYMVQTGSFRGQQDAERQRARIAMQGLRASVQKITLDSGSVWYRVNMGPFDNRSKMNSIIDRLVRISIEPMVRKVPRVPSKANTTKDG